MATFVLIPGAWHGGWCWKKVRPLLAGPGHAVWTPTLTGLGERSHLGGPGVDLSTHIQDVVHLLVYEDLQDVILVGHSYAGMVITGVTERAPARLAQLVYLDAFVPTDGQALVDITAPLPEQRQALATRVRTEGAGWSLPSRQPGPWEPFVREQWGVTAAADLHWILTRLSPHPFATLTEPVQVRNPAAAALPRTYVRCTLTPNPQFDPFAAAARQAGSGWQYRELAAGHLAMVTAPNELAALLLELV